MKFLAKLVDLRGLKVWVLILAILVNLGLTALLFSGVGFWMSQSGGWAEGMDITLMLGEFLVSALIGFAVTFIVHDRRGPSYAVWGAIASFVLVVILMYQSGLLALLVGLMALLGGYNGGMFGARVNLNRAG
ncbi:MAG: hypothetical protein SVR81_07940 [Chloroflexota bacterium]|nr:hypothetical protein [Chloroflexota bacterium]